MKKRLVIETTSKDGDFTHIISLSGTDFTKEIEELLWHLKTYKGQVPVKCYSTNETAPTNW